MQDTKYRNLIKRNDVLVVVVYRYLCHGKDCSQS